MHRASWPNSTFTEQHRHAMAASSVYRRARCLVAYDRDGDGVGTTTVWSAGHGRPGMIEPLGVIGTTVVTATALPSWRRPLHRRRWGRPRPRCAARAGTWAAWRRTSRPASKGSRRYRLSTPQLTPAR